MVLAALELVERAARTARVSAAKQILVDLAITTVDGAPHVTLMLRRSGAKFTGHGRGRGGLAKPHRGRPPKRLIKSLIGINIARAAARTQDTAVNFAADEATAEAVTAPPEEAAAVELPPEAAAAPAAEITAAPAADTAVAPAAAIATAPAAEITNAPAAETTAASAEEITPSPAAEIAAEAATVSEIGGQFTRVAVLEERGEDAEHEVLLAQCVTAAGSAARQVREPADSGWRACWVNVAVVVNGSVEDGAIEEAWEAFLRGEETAEASAARCALAAEAAESAAEVDVRRAVAEEGLTLLMSNKSSGGMACSEKRSNFRFVSWAGIASPNKPWAVCIYDTATRRQRSHGYHATSWEAALKVARVLGPAKCRELEEQRVARLTQAAELVRHVAEATKEGTDAEAAKAKDAMPTLPPALERWAESRFRPPPADLRKWSALQAKPSRASGQWASLGRSQLLVDAVSKIQRPQREREAADAEAWAQAAAEGLTLRTSEKASSGFHNVSYHRHLQRHSDRPYEGRHTVVGCSARGSLGFFASPALAALAVARHEARSAAEHERATTDAPPFGVSAIAGRSHLGVTAWLGGSPRGGTLGLGLDQTELRATFLRRRTEALLQEHKAALLREARREAEERVVADAARAESGGSGSTRRLMQQRRTEAVEAAEAEAALRLAACSSLQARGVKATAHEQALREWCDASAQRELKQLLADEARRELQRSEATLHGGGEATVAKSLSRGSEASCSSDRPPPRAAPPAKRQRTGSCEAGGRGTASDGASVPPTAAAAPDWAAIAPDLPHTGLLHVDEQGAIYRVEALLAVRQNPNLAEHRQFLVRWAEYGAEDDTWEDEENIIDKRLIKAYDRTAKATTKALGKSRARAQQQPYVAIRRSSSVASTAQRADGGGGRGGGDEVDLLACLEASPVQARAAIFGDVAHSPMNAWGFVAESDCGRGLFARVDLTDNQFIAEYAGPRLPGRLQKMGSYVLQIPGANEVVIDGASENSPFQCPCSPAIYANHSTAPNARIEMWPTPRPGSLELRQHMVIVATETIAAGKEIRINYEYMDGTYWKGTPPAETTWRALHVTPPPATREQPVVNRLAELQAAAASGRAAPACAKPRDHGEGLPWEGEDGGDVRLRVLVPLLATKTYGFGGVLSRISYNWAMVATHLPGRSGRECRDRWLQLVHTAMVEAQADCDSDDDDSERCVVLGCKRQLVRCHGIKEAGSSVGVAEESHVLCVPCLERWFASQNELRREQKLPERIRRSCPICQAELRVVRGEANLHLGLHKIDWSWE